jgi:aminomethyltransferase
MTLTTPLTRWHAGHGAQMSTFAGYEMPLWYPAGAKHEHLSVLQTAGLFDTSHMAVVAVDGPGAFDLLQLCFSKDLARCGVGGGALAPGRSVYGVFLDPQGQVIDDAIVFRPAAEAFWVVVNAGMGKAVAGHLRAHAAGRDARITDLTDRVGKLDLQGPQAARVLGRLLRDPGQAFEHLVYFSFKGHFDPASALSQSVRLTDGTPVLLSRTGYTGEFGFEIFVQPDRLPDIWEALLAAGRDFGLSPCGLAARDSLRAGAVLPLSHQDIGAWPFAANPWGFALPAAAGGSGFTKPFIGAEALLGLGAVEPTYPFVGRDPRKVSLEEPALVFDRDGREIGRVLSSVTDMGIGWAGDRIYSVASPGRPPGFEPKGLGCGFVKVRRPLAWGEPVEISDRRRRIPVTIVPDVRPDRTARAPIKAML